MDIPKHIALILDGNGRWAKERGKTRSQGHEEGFRNLVDVLIACNELGIQYATCYAFSTENWNRPKAEVEFLMNVPVRMYKTEKDTFNEQNIKVTFIGRRNRFPKKTLTAIEAIERDTRNNDGLHVLIAFDYGARDELLRAINKISKSGQELTSEEQFQEYLDTKGVPDVDLLIRTSGEERISNFLLWQLAYAELYFTHTYWPSFKKADLLTAIEEYNKRSRRFGRIKDEN